MSRTVTLTNLLEDVRVRADMPAWSTTTFVTEAEATRYINQSIQHLCAIVSEAYGDNYFAQTQTIVASSAYTAMPTRAHKILGMWWARAANDLVPVRRAQQEDLALLSQNAEAWTEPKYTLLGTNIYWLPTPSTTYTVRFVGQYLPQDLSSGSETIEVGPGWDEWIVLDVVRKIFEKQELDVTQLVGLRQDVEARIRAQAPDRHEGENLSVRDYRDTLLGDRDLRLAAWRFG